MKKAKIILLTVGMFFFITLPMAARAQAVSRYWYPGGDGDWSVAEAWNTMPDGSGTSGLPQSDDTVYIGPYGVIPGVVMYGLNNADNFVIRDLHVDNAMTLRQVLDSKLTAGYEFIGETGSGMFEQISGINHILNDINLGQLENSVGSYLISGDPATTILRTERNLNIGVEGTGQVEQSGGAVSVGDGITLGDVSTGRGQFWLNNGVVETQWLHSGVSGDGIFRQTGGTVVVSNDISIALNSGSFGSYNLNAEDGASVLNAVAINVGGQGVGTFTMDDGVLNIADWLGIDSSADDGIDLGKRSTFFLNGGTINQLAGEIKIGTSNRGHFVQTGGDFNYAGAMYLGDDVAGYVEGVNPGIPSLGTYDMAGGTLNGGGLTLGEWGGRGEFVQSGGAVNVEYFDLGRQNPAGKGPGQGHYYMIEGNNPQLRVLFESNIGAAGIGVFDQYAGQHRVEGNMVVGRDQGSIGAYNLNGGDLNVVSTLMVKQNGTGQFNMTGGTLTARSIINNDSFHVHDAGSLETPVSISGNIENNGEFRVTNAVVNFNGTFVNNASFISDPSTMAFSDLEVNPGGFIAAAAEDKYIVNGNFINRSELNNDWQTRNAQLVFNDGDHGVMFNSLDLGALESAYENNFAWGHVDFGNGMFTLVSQDGGRLGALYTGTIGGIDVSGGVLNNFSGDNNIYYLAQYNTWLGNNSFEFSDGAGKLIPVGAVTPEPISSALFLLGGGALAVIGKLRRKA